MLGAGERIGDGPGLVGAPAIGPVHSAMCATGGKRVRCDLGGGDLRLRPLFDSGLSHLCRWSSMTTGSSMVGVRMSMVGVAPVAVSAGRACAIVTERPSIRKPGGFSQSGGSCAAHQPFSEVQCTRQTLLPQ